LGAFHRDTRCAVAAGTPVLLLLRSDFRASERALSDLKKQGRTVAVSLKETGLHQIAQQLRDPGKLSRLIKIVREADGCIATTPEAADIYQRIGTHDRPAIVAFMPTPYPIEDQRWNFAVRTADRFGIFVGTREWDVPSRNHLAALLVARQLCKATGEPVTVANLDGYRGRRLLSELEFPDGKLRVIDKWKSYPDYLRAIAHHKILLQLDRSHVPGQVAGDALLCGIPCVGGDGAIERIAFPKVCGEGRAISEIGSMALELLKNPDLRETIVRESKAHARERLSFEAVRSQLAKFFAHLQQTKAP
jgi:glycosyltransferase involved in cell wall biosynthesis